MIQQQVAAEVENAKSVIKILDVFLQTMKKNVF